MIYIVQKFEVQEPGTVYSLVYVITATNVDPPYTLTSSPNYNVPFATTTCKTSHKVAIKEQRPIFMPYVHNYTESMI